MSALNALDVPECIRRTEDAAQRQHRVKADVVIVDQLQEGGAYVW